MVATFAVAIIALPLVAALPHAAQAITSSTLVNPLSGKCLDVTGGSSANGTQVQILTCDSSARQLWTSTSANELRVTIDSVTKCLDAFGSGTANSTKLIIWTCSGGANQKWNLNSNNTITGVQSGKCVDINGNSAANGAIVQLWSCKTAGNNNQRWVAGDGSRTTINVSGTAGGRTFDGVGAISGGGGNSRLLIDYPEPQRSQLLDYMFKPGYGSAVQLLKIEIGGDANSTDGAEPSIEHVRGVVNCNVGYEFWLAKQAKARNPNIKLGALAWAAPGWIGGGNYWHQDSIDYLVRWLDCAKSNGLTIDYLGGRNEKGHNKTWYQNLRSALNAKGYAAVKVVGNDSVGWKVADDMVADPAFNNAVDIVGVHYPCGYLRDALTCNSTANAVATGKPLWASENGSRDIDSGAPSMIRGIIRGYIDGMMTGYYHWPIIAAITPNLPFATVGFAVAPSPWSGYYRLGKQTWATAHVTQFTQPGWKFLDSGSGYLGGDRAKGSYISLKSTNGTDYSTIIETAAATAAHTVTINVSGGLSAGTVRVWSTNLNSSNSPDHFIKQADVTPSGGRYTLTLQPGRLYSLTTTTGQGKGTATSPAQHNLALPYSDTFESYPVNTMAKYVADMQGIVEVRTCLNGRIGKCLQQVVPVEPILWQGGSDSFALAGDTAWSNYAVSLDVNLQQAGIVKLIGRANKQNRPQRKQAGYELRVDDQGAWALAKRTDQDVLTTLASGTTTALGLRRWRTLTLDMHGSRITAKLGGTTLATVDDASFATGQVGFGQVGFQTNQFDNLKITP